MKICKTKKEIKTAIETLKNTGTDVTLGFVPTMGYLHKGHVSLIEKSKIQNSFTVVSIYVNPTQFAPSEDFTRYPRDEDRDLKICAENNVDIVFMPIDAEMYGVNFSCYVNEEILSIPLCGKYRQNHFKGVTTVVAKLFNIIQPNRAYFGQKDAQQVLVIKRMVRNLDFDIDIIILPTIREADGLALSSRNVHLNHADRKAARKISETLFDVIRLFKEGERCVNTLIRHANKMMKEESGLSVQYIECLEMENLTHVEEIENSVLFAVAAFVGQVRLIDNAILPLNGSD